MASTDSGIDSCIDVDHEMKDVTTVRDDEEASPSENCSDDVAAMPQSRSSIHYDRIVCGDCQAEFSLSTFVEFVEHKVSSTEILLTDVFYQILLLFDESLKIRFRKRPMSIMEVLEKG